MVAPLDYITKLKNKTLKSLLHIWDPFAGNFFALWPQKKFGKFWRFSLLSVNSETFCCNFRKKSPNFGNHKIGKTKKQKKNTAIYTNAFFLALVFGAPFSFSLLILFLVWLKIVALALVGFWAVRELVAHARQLLSISVTFVRLPQAWTCHLTTISSPRPVFIIWFNFQWQRLVLKIQYLL
jgi:hypothetical protein